MTDIERTRLEEVADMLIGTLGEMPSDKADRQVADQVRTIYKLLGYEVKTFVFENKVDVALRLCTSEDVL